MSHEQNTSNESNVDTIPVSDAENAGVSLESALPDTVQTEVRLEDVLPDSVDGTQSLEKVLPDVATAGFEPSAPSKPRVEMIVHEYNTEQFGITARIAPNKTIDFTLTYKPDSVQGDANDPIAEASSLILGWLKTFYAEDDTNAAAPTLQDPEFSVLAFLTRFPFTVVINIKPLLLAERIAEDNQSLPSLVQLRLNNAEPLPEGLAKFVRVQKEIPVDFFDAVTMLVAGTYAQSQGVDKVTMAEIRTDYLIQIPNTKPEFDGNVAPAAVAPKKEKKPKQEPGVKKVEPAAEPAVPKKDKGGVTEVRPQERRRDDTKYEGKSNDSAGIRELDARLRRMAQTISDQHEETIAVLRTTQRQNADLLDVNSALLEDNQTLFGVVNLLLAAIKAK